MEHVHDYDCGHDHEHEGMQSKYELALRKYNTNLP